MSHRHEFKFQPHSIRVVKDYAVFVEKTDHGWCWSRGRESHHEEPSAHWFGPFKEQHQALDQAEEDGGTGWKIFKASQSLP